MRNNYCSAKKKNLLDTSKARPYIIGDIVRVKNINLPNKYPKYGDDGVVSCLITDIDGNHVCIQDLYHSKIKAVIKLENIIERNIIYVGVNPFSIDNSSVRSVSYTLESIISGLDILDENNNGKAKYFVGINKDIPVYKCNWNPHIYNKDGEKEYYQRPFVWKLKDNQLLIESIYQGIDCGKVLVRLRSWAEFDMLISRGETEVFFNDIIDGKQRLNAIRGFIKGEFRDLQGNYYGDLSANAQRKLINHQLISFSELPEDSTDDDVITQFLKLNFTGVPQSASHIKFVKSLQEKLKK